MPSLGSLPRALSSLLHACRALDPSGRRYVSAVAALGAVAHMAAPIFGAASDRAGRRPVVIVSLAIVLAGSMLMLASEHRLLLFCSGVLLIQLGYAGCVCIFGTVVTHYCTIFPAKTGVLTGLFGLFIALGAAAGFGATDLLKVGATKGHYSYFVASVLGKATLLLLAALRIPSYLLDPSGPVQPATPPLTSDAHDATAPAGVGARVVGACAGVGAVLRSWRHEPRYRAWRYVVLARLAFYLGSGP
jgi:MFS family permease